MTVITYLAGGQQRQREMRRETWTVTVVSLAPHRVTRTFWGFYLFEDEEFALHLPKSAPHATQVMIKTIKAKTAKARR